MRILTAQGTWVTSTTTGVRLDTTAMAPAATPGWAGHRHCGRRVVGGVICVVVLVYGLWLATRVVRAIEKVADKYQGRTP